MSYENTIYPLQDKILRAFETAKTRFYLTGGTALSRFYLNHRYSDDLDFFVNDDPEFSKYMVSLYSIFKNLGISLEVNTNEERFQRIYAEGVLKMDFVNDVPFYLGQVRKIDNAPYSRIDNLFNILSNKITAFRDREEVKDLTDIHAIAMHKKPDWNIIFNAANSKSAGIYPPEIAEKLDKADLDTLDRIKWINKPDKSVFKKQLQTIIDDMLRVK